MERKILHDLKTWLHDPNRLPLVLRGARQVGKTWVVRYFAEKMGLKLLELNFERDTHLKSLFTHNDPHRTLLQLETFFNHSIDPSSSLLFLDEIQAAPELLAKLRWFAEELPELAVIATGSLLDFILEDHSFSMPVGRISYLHLEPMSFEEFLVGVDENKLCEFLSQYQLKDTIPEALHHRLLPFLREYILIGGLPAVVKNWTQNKSLISVRKIQQDILSAYRDDFAKYAKRISHERLEEIFKAVPRLIGKKFKYSTVNPEIQSIAVKKALNLLCKAKVCHKVHAVSGDGIPLVSTIKEKVFKVILLDTGLVSAAIGLTLSDMTQMNEINLINQGSISEQLIGQLLRTIYPRFMEPDLFYWIREIPGSEAEIDYLIQHQIHLVPIEVKSGTTGRLKSLHAFMKLRKLEKAIRFNTDYPSVIEIKAEKESDQKFSYQFISLPFYLAEQISRLLNSHFT
ncbi:MAG: AAA family ATPase [Gammaproteobacteria bacterium RIFOXYB2_FULL_38_6]|nr:MAG: AAA family ATPase [Gammaproteobacteria bacterium RIFOXYB2_FULL_38_6]